MTGKSKQHCWLAQRCLTACNVGVKYLIIQEKYLSPMPINGFEPLTLWLQIRCSANWAKSAIKLKIIGWNKTASPSNACFTSDLLDPICRYYIGDCRDRTRTCDLKGMNLVSYQLLLLCLNLSKINAHESMWHYVWYRKDRIRTCDPLLPKQVRYQTALLSDNKIRRARDLL